ncbi:unnamed protein product [Owenia fusiformis]|uniref:Uncharacterized protein n=1 Tax=Owenia fusiformis TaxID=6347 RepID=A0A8J1UMN9_OWEFU|nr:unnamed protein product [Owenia fusiformis]
MRKSGVIEEAVGKIRAKIVVVLSDGVSFDTKTNMDATLAETKAEIKRLQSQGVTFATYNLYEYIRTANDDRSLQLEYNLYKPILQMDHNNDFRDQFVKALFDLDGFICEDKVTDPPPTEAPIVCGVPKLDVVYVIDRSKSIAETDINKVKDFLVELSRKILQTSPESWIGALSYNHIVPIPEMFLQGPGLKRDENTIIKGLKDIGTNTDWGTYTHKALKYARTNINYLNNNKNRKDAMNLIILITDGVTNVLPYLTKNPKKQGKFSKPSVIEAGHLKPTTDLILIGLPNKPAEKLLQGSPKDRILGQAKIDAGEKEWKDMIAARYPDDPKKLKSNFFKLETMEGLMERFNDILATVCGSSSA